jgi:hypothetical protein
MDAIKGILYASALSLPICAAIIGWVMIIQNIL